MEEIVRLKMEAITKKAKEGGYKAKASSRHRSSLHKILNTKEKADAFMRQLQSLQAK